MKKFLLLLIIAIIVAALLMFNFKLGWNGGNGSGDNDESKSTVSSTESLEDKNIVVTPEAQITTIEINKDEYIINNKTLSITKVEAMLSDDSSTEFIIIDNYGSAKAWDELKELFIKYDKQYIEE